jgi:hypothetical protein
MSTWELLTSVAVLQQVRLKLFIPTISENDYEQKKSYATEQFAFPPDMVDFVSVICHEPVSKEELWLLRDRAIVEACDIMVPVSIRERGHMATLLKEGKNAGKRIEQRFLVNYSERRKPLAYRLPNDHLNPALEHVRDRYLIHWTRASNSAWPTERLIDFYQAIIESDSYPRSAFDTLLNVLVSKKVVASSRNMPQSIATVSFSGLSPVEVIPLVRWRSRYRQMSFEPYGIGIEKCYARRIGIQPVIYYDKQSGCPETVPPWLLQSTGERGDWRPEREYRHRGDLDLSAIPLHRMCAFCYTPQEAESIEKNTGIRTIPFLRREAPLF